MRDHGHKEEYKNNEPDLYSHRDICPGKPDCPHDDDEDEEDEQEANPTPNPVTPEKERWRHE